MIASSIPLLRRHMQISGPVLSLFFFLLGMVTTLGAQSSVDIHSIQVDLPSSPYLGIDVSTSGIVTAVLPDGFYIENSTMDQNVCSAEGIFVYTGKGNVPSTVALKDAVTVTGIVTASNNSAYAGTQINVDTPIASNISVTATGKTLPSTIGSSTLESATEGANGTCTNYTAGTFGDWLPFEGMRVNVPSSSSLLVVGPSMDSTSGQFWAILYSSSSDTRPMRATGISVLDSLPSTAPSTVSRWSGNPQLLLVDTATLGGTALNPAAGTLYSGSANLIGIIDYHVNQEGYTGLLLDSSSVSSLTASNTVTPTKATTPSSGQITIGTLELASLTATESTRISKLANAIVNYMHTPDVLNLQSATADALTALKSAVATASGSVSYSDLGITSTADSNGMVNAIWFNAAKFDADTANPPAITQQMAASSYTTLASATSTLFARSPLQAHLGIPRTGTSDYNIEVVNASLLDRSSIDDSSTGAEVRYQREQQAEQLATQLLEPIENAGEHLFLAGGFNSFEFSDGFVDTMGILDGSEAASSLVTLYDATYNSSTLINTTTTALDAATSATNASTNRYTYVENGSAEQPDHILITSELSDLVTIDYARIGADFPTIDATDSTTVARASSHDGIVTYLTVPYPTTTTLTASPVSPTTYGQQVTFTATVTSENGAPSGTVTFTDGSSTLCASSTLTVGSTSSTATCITSSTSPLSVGTHSITASYNGVAAYTASTASISYEVDSDATTLALSSSSNPSYYGDSVTFTATAVGAYGTPAGSVTFSIDGTPATATLAATSGTYTAAATLTSSTLSVGTHTVTASYAGSGINAAASSNSLTQTVYAVYDTSSVLACSPNPAAYESTITCTDTVSSTGGTPTGTVTFYDGTTSLGTGTLSSTGIATLFTSTLSVGSHNISAVYSTSKPFVTSTSNTVAEIILSTFSLSITPAAQSVYTGEAATYALTVTPGTGFTLDVALTCSGAPTNSTCTITPSTVSGGSGTAKVVLQTTAPAQSNSTASLKRNGRSALPLLAGGLLLLLLPTRARRRLRALSLLVVLACGLYATLSLTACSGSGTLTGGTTAGTYTLTITGTAQDGTVTITEPVTATLTVKSMF